VGRYGNLPLSTYHLSLALDVKGKRVLVVGLGKSGVASAIFLKDRGARVSVSDAKTEDQLPSAIPALLDKGISVETGGHGERTFRDQDLIVVSPGVPSDVLQLERARAQGIPIIGEVELASRFLKGHIVAITGSNGKTTTTALLGEVIGMGGYEVLVGGNIGTPAISLVSEATSDTYNVLEISSFQLESIESFHPEIAVVLNITPDHLDRHHSFDAYVLAKARIFENQTAQDHAVLNADDPTCAGLAGKTRAQVHWFSRSKEVDRGAFVREGKILARDESGDQEVMPASSITLKGTHNLENVLAAVCAGRIVGCEPHRIRRAVEDFKAVEHRLEYVMTIQGVEYYNDSKATNVDATIKALESFPGNIHIILGGKDKGSDYSVLKDLLHERAKRVYTIGAAAEKIESQISGAVPVLRAEMLETAVKRAAESAAPGDIVLLAPACASFDQFESYEHRGRVFKEAVQALAARKAPTEVGGAA
jgi:UDP-N-acetylmuramoylalanine--D-glutamate ligase